jgi:hypothetical protein
MRLRWLSAVLLGACGFHPGAIGADGDASIDHDGPPPIDGPDIDAPPGSYCLGDATIQICLSQVPSTALDVDASVTIDTDDPSMCATNVVGANMNQFCVLAGSDITVRGGKILAAKGTRPLVLVSSNTIKVMGAIDVAAHTNGTPQDLGAGGDAVCAGATAPTPGGGGYGGSFGAPGGLGGSRGIGGAGGLPPTPIPNPPALRGGCSGADGPGGGAGGHSGGAVALIAATSIQIDGVINASGAGGAGSQVGGRGGGGGGSGGMIVIDATTVTGAGGAKIFANGGGGGEGSGGNDGRDGQDAPADPTMAAVGGNGGSSGGDGGNGSKGNGLLGNAPGPGGGATIEGAGGGGGGAGVIKLYKAASLPGTVSPPPT